MAVVGGLGNRVLRPPDSPIVGRPKSGAWFTTYSGPRDVTTALDGQLAASSRQIVVGWSALSVDIETNPADGDRIFKIGAVRSDNDTFVSLPTSRLDPADVVRRVNVTPVADAEHGPT